MTLVDFANIGVYRSVKTSAFTPNDWFLAIQKIKYVKSENQTVVDQTKLLANSFLEKKSGIMRHAPV